MTVARELGPQFVDAIEELLQPCHSASEHIRNFTLADDNPLFPPGTAVVVRYQDDLVSRWQEDWPSLKHAVLDWAPWVTSSDPGEIGVLNEDVHSRQGFARDYSALAELFTHEPWLDAAEKEAAQHACNVQAMLDDQLGLFDLWTSRLRSELARA